MRRDTSTVVYKAEKPLSVSPNREEDCETNIHTSDATPVGMPAVRRGTPIAPAKAESCSLGRVPYGNEPIHGTRNQFPDREKLKSDTSEVMDKAKQAGEQRLDSRKQTAAAQALGAEIGAALPSTEQEDRWIGEMRDKAMDRAKQLGGEVYEKGCEAAKHGIDSMTGDSGSVSTRP